jgi:hypothetical protein
LLVTLLDGLGEHGEVQIDMHEKLLAEIAATKTRKFYVINPGTKNVSTCMQLHYICGLPFSYTRFLEELGDSRLFRDGNGYIVGVHSIFLETELAKGRTLLHFGHRGSANAYFDRTLLKDETTPVFESSSGGLRQVANGFSHWMEKALSYARKQYSREEWRKIVNGPLPFNAKELSIVEARKKFKWVFVRNGRNGKAIFEVTNGSKLVLPYLSLGLRHQRGLFEGCVWLKTANIVPGESGLIEHDCYSELAPLEEMEIFDLPDPEPEDRTRYWEFSK